MVGEVRMAGVKVYLCSNPEDSVVERKYLRENIFPKLRDHCRRTYGVDFRVIDPYERVDSANWPTQEERRLFIEECRENSLGPFFVALVGEQYGTVGLPEQVDLCEFMLLLQMCQNLGFSCVTLEKLYRRDENTIPPKYCLIRLEVEDSGRHADLEKARMMMQYAVTECVQQGDIKPEEAQKYCTSDLEKDLCFALKGRSRADIKRCLCYVNKPFKTPDRRKTDDKPPTDYQTTSVALKELREDFLPNLVQSHKALVYTTISTTTMELSGEQSYAEELSHQLYSDLKQLIDQSVEKNEDQTQGFFSQQRELCDIFSRLYKIERDEVTHVRAYLEQDTNRPLVLVGGPCTGKSVFLAHCANQIKTWMKDQDPVVIVQFTDSNTSLKQSLLSMCHQIASSYNLQYNTHPKNIFKLKETFSELLSIIAESSKPLILIIDGFDQMPNGPVDMTWLPKTLPSNVKLIMSSTPMKSGFLSAIKSHYSESTLFFDLEPLDSKSCNQMLTTLLLAANRRITSGQQMYVNQAFKECSLPLYVELLFRQVRCWGSELEITPDTLVPGVHANIELFLDHLEEKHGKVLISRALQYLSLSRHGLTEAELTDILSCDDEVLSDFLPLDNDVPYKSRVPEIAVEAVLLDLKGFMIPRNTLGTLFWASRHFNLVINKRYLSSNEQQSMYSLLANYFSGRWAGGTAKPLTFTASHGSKMSDSITVQKAMPKKMYSNRQVPGQPWMFQPLAAALCNSGLSKSAHPNLRKLQELPFHLMQSGSFEELGRMMLSQEFLDAMFQAGLEEELVFWIEEASRNRFPRALRLLATFLKTSDCWMKDCTADLVLVMQAHLFPFVNVFPKLGQFVNQTINDGKTRRSGVSTILSPSPSVPATHWELPSAKVSPFVKVDLAQSESAVVIQDNGSAWVWNGSDSEGFNLSQSSELKFADVRCAANVFMLLTQSGKLLLWDVNAPSSYFQEVQTHQEEQGQESTLQSIDGILVSNRRIFAFSRGRSFVQVFEERREVAPLQCSSFVTCMSCSVDGYMICCGQNDGTLSIFDSQSGLPLTSFICSKGMPLFDLILNENEEAISGVDCTGSVFVWDIRIPTIPELIKESLSSSKEDILNTDHSEEGLLLICKRQRIQIVDILLLDIEDQFNAPRGKTFIQAILDPETHFIIALVKDCSFLLVWNLFSGQCVLSLDFGSTEAFKLMKPKECPNLTVVTSTGITNWDMDLVSVAASTPKSGREVLKVIVGPKGGLFYTSDGSELVWRWTVFDWEVKSHLLHHGPVEDMALSVDGNLLLTIASGNIYVWNTSTNANIHRIQDSQAARLLLPPKGNSAVSLSETGLSRVWNLCTGLVVCSIHHHLRDAVISPERTFLMGINKGDLLAVSLWSGYISKQFSSSEWSEVVAFFPLIDHPDCVMVITSSGALYSWRLTEDTVCQRFQFPDSFQYPPQFFNVLSGESYGMISVDDSKISILDVKNCKLCSLKAEGPVCQKFVGISGKYAVYICSPSMMCRSYTCDLHARHILVAIRVTDGKKVGKVYLSKTPSALTLSEELCVYVGFEDGSVGVYAINDGDGNAVSTPKCGSTGRMCPFDEPEVWSPLASPNISWEDFK
ncbi:NACHT and WD repeat domain-containing protein 2 [Astyanax mexicanus]|uniref:NACHT and WD repeat domain-containing protein 2 n=1 Tax=Astyanax mexicanus TaxID=7994 RepID=UPI0020CAEB34|nr:NACHT and WD repeat domain-containing protein 2 [Astyanax mexicanus]